MDPTNAPRVLISYSHDGPKHESNVLVLSDRLRKDGVDSNLDQYETFPSQGWPSWMEHQVKLADFVLVICTEAYKRRAEMEEAPGKGLGATFEGRLIRQLLYNAGGHNTKFIPVLMSKSDGGHIPLVLQGYTYFELETEEGYDVLWRFVVGRPEVTKPPLGPLPVREMKADFRTLFVEASQVAAKARQDRLAHIKRQLKYGGDVRAFSKALIEIRSMLIADEHALERAANRAFFDKWCQQTFVKLEWPAGGEYWNGQNIPIVLAELETLEF